MVYRKRNHKKVRYDRINSLAVIAFAFSLFLILKLFSIQVLEYPLYDALAKGQYELYEKLFSERGEILVRDLKNPDKLMPIATNQQLNLIYAVPRRINDPKMAAEKISVVLDLEEEVIFERLSKENDLYEPIKHGVDDEGLEKVEALEIEGIESMPESFRYYPEAETASHISGFVGFGSGEERIGQYGLEGYFEDELAGNQGYLKTERDAGGRWITVGSMKIVEAKDGDDLVLTIDHTIQFTACTKLKNEVIKHGADSGTLIIIDPKTGAILAMCGYPDFDPNNYQEAEGIEVFKNPAIYSTYEPGSVFKPVTMAAALDLGKVTPNTTYQDPGEVKIGKYTIKNFDLKSHGTQTMTQVLEQSLNTGAIFAMNQIGEKMFYKYVDDFGFGEKTGIRLDTESPGDISTLENYREIYASTASFGHGITVTPLQLVNAFSAIANKGKLMRPYIIDEVIKSDGFRVKTEPEVIRQVISSQTATTLTAMLVNVVRNGHGKRAGVSGYFVAGKTGTAQVPKIDGPGYETDYTIGSFAGFAPASDPKFAMLVKIDRPRDVQWAESSAAPLFGEMAQFLLNYFEVPPSQAVE